MLYPAFRRNLIEKKLAAAGDRIVVAVSGGIDSMVLLDLLARAAPRLKLSLVVAHVNHRLRGRTSDADEALVRRTAEAHGIPCEVAHLTPPKGRNLQDAARSQRRAFLRNVAAASGAAAVATAHHRGDQAETVLLHLLRGAGLAGLRGMAWAGEGDGFRLIRPLLANSRAEIERYAADRHIVFREDATNRTVRYQRNALRHKLLPLMRTFNPRIEEALAHLAERLALEEEALDCIAAASFEEARVRNGEGGVALRIEAMAPLPAALRRRLLKQAFAEAAGSSRNLNADQLIRMDAIAGQASPRGSYRLPDGWTFAREGRILHIRRG